MWARGPLLSTRSELAAAGRAGFDDLFSLGAVDELLSRRGLRTPFIRLAKNGVVAPTGRYTRSGGTGAQVADQVADDRVLELFLDGHTVVLQGLHRLWPPLIEFAGALTTDLGHPVQVNAYITPASSQGFSAHYDVHDVFVLQVAGEKRWRISEPVHPAPLRDQPWTDRRAEVAARAQEEPLLDTVLTPGDALYLPRGYLHAAEALGGVSCHLTVGVHPVTRHAVLEALLAIVADEPELRTSLPMGVDVGDPAAVEADVQATVAALTERLRSVTAADVAIGWVPASSTATGRPRSGRSRRPRRWTGWTPGRCSSPAGTCGTWSPRTRTRLSSGCRTAPSRCPRRPARRCGRCSTASGCGSATCPAWTRRTRSTLARRLVREAVVVVVAVEEQ